MSSINNDSLGINPLFVGMFMPHPKGWGKNPIISSITPSFMTVFQENHQSWGFNPNSDQTF